MTSRTVDVAIIGAGTAGMAAYRNVAEHTDSVLLIEGGRYGTTCARVGCMPSKLLIAAAEAAHHGSRTAPFGITYGAPRIDGRAVMDRVRRERDRFVGFVLEAVEKWPEAHKIEATARFEGDHRLSLSDGTTVEAGHIIIATGSRPNVPPPFDPIRDKVQTSDDVFFWDDLPESIAVFGGGVIGLELGQALARLGVRMALYGEGGFVGQLSDPRVLETARAILSEEFAFFPDADVKDMRMTAAGVEIEQAVAGRVQADRFDSALVCVGRTPNVTDLGLETTSLALDDQGVPHYDPETRRCGDSTIYIAGDADNAFPLLHVATHAGRVAGNNAVAPRDHHAERPVDLAILFCDPQIVTVGARHEDLVEGGADFEVGEVAWSEQGRARVMLANQGLLRVYGEKGSNRFLGAEMIGPRAEHLGHLLAWALHSELKVDEMLEREFYHPCLEEGLRTALRNLAHELGLGPAPLPRCLDCGPGA